MWQFVLRNPASFPHFCQPDPRHLLLLLLLLFPPFGHKPSRYWSKLLVQCARDGRGREGRANEELRTRRDRTGNQLAEEGTQRGAGLHAGVCDRRVDEEQRWQLVFGFIVNSTANNFATVWSTNYLNMNTKRWLCVCFWMFGAKMAAGILTSETESSTMDRGSSSRDSQTDITVLSPLLWRHLFMAAVPLHRVY